MILIAEGEFEDGTHEVLDRQDYLTNVQRQLAESINKDANNMNGQNSTTERDSSQSEEEEEDKLKTRRKPPHDQEKG